MSSVSPKSHLVMCRNIGTLSMQELFFQLIGWLKVELGVSTVGMVYFMGWAICAWFMCTVYHAD